MAIERYTTIRWHGHDVPVQGMFLATPKGRTAYEVIAVSERKRADQKTVRLSCVRHERKEIEPGLLTQFFWLKR